MDNPLKVFEKLINLDELLRHLKLESERYAAQNGKTFEVCMNKLSAFIGVNFVMGYHKLPNLRSYWETRSTSLSVHFVANVMTRERFREILGNPHFSNNKDVVSRDHSVHDRVFEMRWLIDYFNERFLSSMEHKVGQMWISTWSNVKAEALCSFRIWCTYVPKTDYLYKCDIYTGRNETTSLD